MKKIIRMAAAAVLSGLLMLTGGPLSAFAAVPPEVNLNGYNADPVWEYDSSNVTVYTDQGGKEYYDLFGSNTKELVPGSQRDFVVQFRNRSPNSVTFYLKARAFTDDEAGKLTDRSGITDFAGKNALMNTDLLKKVHIRINSSAAASGDIYSGDLAGLTPDTGGNAALYGGGAPGVAGVALGTLAPGNYGSLRIEVEVDESLNNEYFDALCAVEWIFYADQDVPRTPPPPDDGPPDDGGPEDTPTPDPIDPTPEPTTEPTSAPTDPAPTESAPAPTDQPTAPTPTESASTDPEPTSPAPTEPASSEPEPTPTQPPYDSGMSDDPPAVPPTQPGPGQTVTDDPVPLGPIDDGPLTDLPDDLTPQGSVNNLPEGTDMVVVVDPEIPLALPQTGGLITFATPAALALAVLIGLYAATFLKKRRNEEA